MIGPAATAPTAPTAPPLLALPWLQLQPSMQSLWHRAPVIEALQADGLVLNLARAGTSRYDIDDPPARLAGPPDKPAPAGEEPARFAVYSLAVQQTRIRLDDQPAGRVHEITDLSLGLLAFLPGTGQRARLQAQTEVGDDLGP